jgi:3-hydroxymyristoyl/3-hydroxydecanoyl-(acyl carrier protein) dehydratase
MRWDLISEFEFLKKGARAKAFKDFDGKEDFFAENFPGRPLVPEPLFMEMIAQAGGVLVGLGVDFRKEVILAKISEARFFAPVAPPCRLEIEAWIEEEREEGGLVTGVVRFKGKDVATAKLFLVTIDSLNPDGNGKKVVFNDGFLKHYRIPAVVEKSLKVSC